MHHHSSRHAEGLDTHMQQLDLQESPGRHRQDLPLLMVRVLQCIPLCVCVIQLHCICIGLLGAFLCASLGCMLDNNQLHSRQHCRSHSHRNNAGVAGHEPS